MSTCLAWIDFSPAFEKRRQGAVVCTRSPTASRLQVQLLRRENVYASFPRLRGLSPGDAPAGLTGDSKLCVRRGCLSLCGSVTKRRFVWSTLRPPSPQETWDRPWIGYFNLSRNMEKQILSGFATVLECTVSRDREFHMYREDLKSSEFF